MKIINVKYASKVRVGDVLVSRGLSNYGLVVAIGRSWKYIDVTYVSTSGNFDTIAYYDGWNYDIEIMR